MDAVAPILDSKGRPIALLVFRSNAESLLYPLIQSWPTPNLTSETLLVRKGGEDLLFLNDLRHRPNTALSLQEPLTLTDLPAVQAVLGKQGMFQGRDYRGVEVLADLRPIANSPWFMVAKVDAFEILAEARYRGGVTALLAGLFILLAAGVTAYGYRHRQARLYQDLYRSEREQRAAQEQFRTTLYSIGDAVITTDIGGLVKQMNPVAELLTGWLETEARGKHLDEVFHIVNEESRDVVENPVKRVLREGQVVGLANHTLLLAKDGTEHAIADSGAPIVDEHGAINGVVLVFREQTEERAAQEALKESEEQYRRLFEYAPLIYVITRNEQGVPFISDCNELFLGSVSYSREEAMGKPLAHFYSPESREELLERGGYARALAGEFFMGERELVRRDGSLLPTLLYTATEVDPSGQVIGTRAMFVDITERKRAEEALKIEREQLLSIFESINEVILVIEPQTYELLYANRFAKSLFGKDLIGKKCHKILNKFDDPCNHCQMDKIIELRGEPYQWEYHNPELNREYLATDRMIRWPDGRDVKFQLAIDITERKRAEEALSVQRQRKWESKWDFVSGEFGTLRFDH